MDLSSSDVIESYQSNFKSSLGAYVYMHLNQIKPEFFVLSHNNFNSKLTDICKEANSLKEILNAINELPNSFFDTIQLENNENDLSKKAILKTLRNIEFLDINWQDKNSWIELKGHIEFNNYSLFLDNEKQQQIQTQLSSLVEKFGMKKISINPNFSPESFIHNLEQGLKELCQTLDFQPKQIGLGFLEVNYKTEDGDFTGYMNSTSDDVPFNNKMVINKLEVFTHEWMHFIESCLGVKGHALTGLMKHFSSEEFKIFLPELSKLGEFPLTLVQNEKQIESLSFIDSMKSASHFFERYALDKENFYNNLEIIFENTLTKIHSKSSEKEILKSMQSSIEDLLSDRHPTRYFSFLKAQCNMEIKRHAQEELTKNQFIDFSKQADQHLGENDYTASLIETFARSFETFAFSKCKNTKVLANTYDSDFYPQGKMRSNFNDFWTTAWSQIKAELNNISPAEPSIKNKSFSINNISVFREKYNKNNTTSKSLKV